MRFLDYRFGPMRLRAWGLIANMLANATALYGLSQVLRDGSGQLVLVVGAGLSLALIAVLAVPSR